MKRSRPTVSVSSLSAEQIADVERQLAGHGPGRVHVAAPTVTVATPARSPYTGTGAKRGMSRNEQRFADHLHDLGLARQVSGWSYELLRVALPAKRSTAVLDFVVRACGAWGFDGLVVVEVKPRGKDGRPYFGPKGRLRIKLVAEQLAGLEVPVLVAWPSDDGWRVELVEARS